MRRLIINAGLGGILGGVLGAHGYVLSTWQFWAVMIWWMCVMINCGYRSV
jgi:hypothetical protein